MGRDDVQSEHCWEEASGHGLASAFGVCLSLSIKSTVPVCLETCELSNHKFQEDGCNTGANMTCCHLLLLSFHNVFCTLC